ncbi:LuxR C-terminal-related transcriptional regulator [Streptomyces sp. ACA25]|uniref:helix-turn-helix transcriptional regulator n=1 Tax=Streptomyces sp. ACA25 TaxID=3022596 RepID=UPI0023072DF2|nr:LuxR C-terminal-related transcriptional regulator [Streptomyces sp. ACA25]MDB1090024.1 LuxR C-terminal-related transcriptional regulator [Streptomyces sp. ACA25]
MEKVHLSRTVPPDPRTSAALEEMTAARAAGSPVLLHITGDPGLGKTRLLEQLAVQARDKGFTVAHGTADARPRVVSCLDDLHLAADSTWEQLHHLLGSRPAAPALICCALRPRQLQDSRARVLARVHPAWRVHRIDLGPLGAPAVEALLPPGTPRPRRDLLYRLSEGVPGWLGLLIALPDPDLRELAATGLLRGASPAGAAPGPRSELAALPADLRVLARAAAVLGDPFDPAMAAAVAGHDLTAVLAALDELCTRDIFRAGSTGPEFRFRHPLLRAQIHAQSPPGWRIGAHARAAEVLGAAGADPVCRAPHLVRSAAPGDRAAARDLCSAADRVLTTAPGQAARWLGAARRIAPCAEESTVLRPLLTRLYRAAERTGQDHLCRELLPELRRLLVTDLPEDWAAVVDLHAGLETACGHDHEARALLTAESRTLPGAVLDGTARLHLAAFAAARGERPEVRRLLESRSLSGPAAAGPAFRLDAAATLALVGVTAPDPAALRDGTAQARELLDRMSDAELAERLPALLRLARAWDLPEHWCEAERLLARGVRAAQKTGRTAALPHLLVAHGHQQLVLGRLDAAHDAAHRAAAAAFVLDRPDLAGDAQLLEACAAGWRDGPEAADGPVEGVAAAAHPGSALHERALCALALVRLVQRRPVDAQHLLGASPAPGLLPSAWWAFPLMSPAAHDRTGSGTSGEQAWRAVLGAAAHRPGLAPYVRELGQPDTASVTSLRAVAERYAEGGGWLPECGARLLLARRLLVQDREGDARDELGRVKQRPGSPRARWTHQQVVDLQRRLGARRPRGRVPSGTAFSEREWEIVRLVCLGLANRDIAAALFVSVKTVETHLTRVFRKAGVRSRAALAVRFVASDVLAS